MNGANQILFGRVAWVGEVESTLGIEGQVVWTSERHATAFGRGRFERLAIRGDSQHGMLAGIADQVCSVGEDLVAVGSAGDDERFVAAVEFELGDGIFPRDIALAIVIEDNAFAVVVNFEQFDRFYGVVSR